MNIYYLVLEEKKVNILRLELKVFMNFWIIMTNIKKVVFKKQSMQYNQERIKI